MVPFHSYILKVASRCNLNCTYCFVYNTGDNRWKAQPKFIDDRTLRMTCRRMIEHCKSHEKKDVLIILHGGEPLLGGIKHLHEMQQTIKGEFDGTKIEYRIAIQSNGVLFTKTIGDFLLEHRISLGVSIDGPPKYNDIYRVDHKGRGSSKKLEAKLKILSDYPYNSIFSGFLTVINIDTDPNEIFDYLAQFNPKVLDFLLPYDHWSRRPKGKDEFESTPYADWLIKLFDHWFKADTSIKIKMFDSYMNVLLGGLSTLESIGLSPVDIIVVESNGDIEAVDSLKATYEGATVLGYNVFDHSFDQVLHHTNVQMRQVGSDGLCSDCRNCEVVDYCGGGYVPNRYSAANGFDNPSIYCRDLEKLIRHIHKTLAYKVNNELYVGN